MLDRRPTLPYRGSVSFRQPHQPNISNLQQFPRTIIVGRAFGPFLRSTSLQQQAQIPAGTSTFRRQKSIDGDMILVESRHAGYQGGDGNKLQVVTSRQAETTRIDINPDGTTNTVAPSSSPPARQGEKVAKTEEINARNNRQYNSSNNNNCQTTTRASKDPPAAAALTGQYKFLRRQYSMDQKQLRFQIGPSAAVQICNSRWARSHRCESVDVISGRDCVGTASGETVKAEEDRRKEQKHWEVAVGQEDQEEVKVFLGCTIDGDDPSNSWLVEECE